MRAPRETVDVHGLVVSSTEIGERDRLISLLTAENGMIPVYVSGARQIKNRYLAATGVFCYGRYTVSESAGRYHLEDVKLEETFYDLRLDLTRAALATYICDVVAYTGTETPDTELLRLTLNALYAVSRGLYPLPLIKAVFELRMAAILGFTPDVSACALCGCVSGEFLLNIPEGQIVCSECREGLAVREADTGEDKEAPVALLTEGVRDAIRYVTVSPLERLFSFRVTDDDARLLYRAAEDFLLWHIDRSFHSLTFYKQVSESV